MFKKTPFLLALVILFIALFGYHIPLEIKRGMYAFSVTLKSIIISVLPIVIFGLLFRAATMMARKATWIVGLMLVGVCISTFTALFVARFVGLAVYHADIAMSPPSHGIILQPLWNGDWTLNISNAYVMLAALFIGVVGGLWTPELALRWSAFGEKVVSHILSGLGWVVLPFVAGFVIKLQYEGSMGLIFHNYSYIFLIVALAQTGYLVSVYWAISGFSFRQCWHYLSNMMPAVMSGFSTMSSAASLPLMIQGIEKNTIHKQLAKVVGPALVNIHWVGECFADVILAYAVLKTFGMPEPSLYTYCVFAFYFFLARFAVVAVPGGGIIVAYPLLIQYFQFNDDMVALIMALYMLFDPLLTVGNILGDGAFAQCLDRLVSRYPRLVYSSDDTGHTSLKEIV